MVPLGNYQELFFSISVLTYWRDLKGNGRQIFQRGCFEGGNWFGRKRPLAATCLDFVRAATCGHLRPLAWNWLRRPLAATCSHADESSAYWVAGWNRFCGERWRRAACQWIATSFAEIWPLALSCAATRGATLISTVSSPKFWSNNSQDTAHRQRVQPFASALFPGARASPCCGPSSSMRRRMMWQLLASNLWWTLSSSLTRCLIRPPGIFWPSQLCKRPCRSFLTWSRPAASESPWLLMLTWHREPLECIALCCMPSRADVVPEISRSFWRPLSPNIQGLWFMWFLLISFWTPLGVMLPDLIVKTTGFMEWSLSLWLATWLAHHAKPGAKRVSTRLIKVHWRLLIIVHRAHECFARWRNSGGCSA